MIDRKADHSEATDIRVNLGRFDNMFKRKKILIGGTVAALGVGGAVAVSGVAGSLGANAAEKPSFYSNYPASATTTTQCQASDIKDSQFRIGTWTNTKLGSYTNGLKPGDVIKWTYRVDNPNCRGEKASFVLYSSVGPNWSATEDQAQVVSNTYTLPTDGYTNTHEITVPRGFRGPYQLIAVVGRPLPIVGPDGGYYNSSDRKAQKTGESDGRNMAVSNLEGSTDDLGNFGSFAKQASQTSNTGGPGKFDYEQYEQFRQEMLRSGCTSNLVGRSFTVNGTNVGDSLNNVQLKGGDVVVAAFWSSVAACQNKPVSFSLYRNPYGPDGLLDPKMTQTLAATVKGTLSGQKSTLTLRLPRSLRGGYQTDLAFGPALPFVGSAGSTYQDLLISGSHNLAGIATQVPPLNSLFFGPSDSVANGTVFRIDGGCQSTTGELTTDGYDRTFTSEQWTFRPVGDGTYYIVSYCADYDPMGGHALYANADSRVSMERLASNPDDTRFRWVVDYDKQTGYRFVNVATGQALDHGTSAHRPVTLTTPSTSATQRWMPRLVPGLEGSNPLD